MRSFLDHYVVLQTIGSGATCKVKLIQDPKSSQLMAAKILKLTSQQRKLQFQSILRTEVASLQRISHQNVITFFGASQSGIYIKKNGEMYECFYILMQVCRNGELFDLVFQTGGFTQQTCRYFFRQMIQALQACHFAGITHRDIKPQNLLFDSLLRLKLTDFGFSKLITPNSRMSSHVGTENYMAPQVHLKKEYQGQLVDIFACGVTLFIMKCRNPPFLVAMSSNFMYRALNCRDHRF